MDQQVTREQFAAVPLFAALDGQDLDDIVQVTQRRHAPTGTVLADQGDFSSTFYVLLDGSVTVHRDGRHIADLHAGDVFGEAGTLTCAPRNATVIATTPADVAVIMGWDLRNLLTRMPTLRSGLEAISAERSIQG